VVFSNLSVIVSVSQRNYKYLLVELVAFAGFFDDYVVFKATILNMAFAEACRPFAGPSLLSRDVSNVNNNIASRSADGRVVESHQTIASTGFSFSRRRPIVYSSQTLLHLRTARPRTWPSVLVELLRQLGLLYRRGCGGAGSTAYTRAIPS